MHLADAFIQSDLQLQFRLYIFISKCVPWESNPQPFALLTQCSTTEPHRNTCVLSCNLCWNYFGAIFLKLALLKSPVIMNAASGISRNCMVMWTDCPDCLLLTQLIFFSVYPHSRVHTLTSPEVCRSIHRQILNTHLIVFSTATKFFLQADFVVGTKIY